MSKPSHVLALSKSVHAITDQYGMTAATVVGGMLTLHIVHLQNLDMMAHSGVVGGDYLKGVAQAYSETQGIVFSGLASALAEDEEAAQAIYEKVVDAQEEITGAWLADAASARFESMGATPEQAREMLEQGIVRAASENKLDPKTFSRMEKLAEAVKVDPVVAAEAREERRKSMTDTLRRAIQNRIDQETKAQGPHGQAFSDMGDADKFGLAASINNISEMCYNTSAKAGWWQDAEGKSLLTNPYAISNKLFLIISEVVEAGEGDRKDKMDDHLPHRKAIEVELADAIIRIADLAGALRLDLGGAMVEKMAYNQTRADHQPGARQAAGGKRY